MTTHQITSEIPEEVLLAEKTDAPSFGREMKMLSAVKLFEMGRLPSGWAAELSDMPRLEFLLNLSHYKAFPLAELDDLYRSHAPSLIVMLKREKAQS